MLYDHIRPSAFSMVEKDYRGNIRLYAKFTVFISVQAIVGRSKGKEHPSQGAINGDVGSRRNTTKPALTTRRPGPIQYYQMRMY